MVAMEYVRSGLTDLNVDLARSSTTVSSRTSLELDDGDLEGIDDHITDAAEGNGNGTMASVTDNVG